MIAYIPQRIETVEQAEALPEGSAVVRLDIPWIATKRGPDRNGAQYTTIDVTQDPDAIGYLTDLGHRALPVVVLDTGAHWSGFKPDLIDAATKEAA